MRKPSRRGGPRTSGLCGCADTKPGKAGNDLFVDREASLNLLQNRVRRWRHKSRRCGKVTLRAAARHAGLLKGQDGGRGVQGVRGEDAASNGAAWSLRAAVSLDPVFVHVAPSHYRASYINDIFSFSIILMPRHAGPGRGCPSRAGRFLTGTHLP